MLDSPQPLTARLKRSEHIHSYYAATANSLPDYPRLEQAISCDVCVVGGGFTGLSCALHLAELGLDVVLLEAERVGWGASGRNGGQVGSGQRQDQNKLEALLGKEHAKHLWHLAEEAKQTVNSLIEKHRIQCDLKTGVLHPMHKASYVQPAHAYVNKLKTEYDYKHISAVSNEEMRDMLGTRMYFGGWLDTGATHLHPLNYALGLAQAAAQAGVRIYENSRVTRYRPSGKIEVHSATAAVTADFMVLACNAYLQRLEPRIAGKIMPINNFILATEPLTAAEAKALIRDDVAVADSKFVINYFRLSADKRLLFGGGENYRRSFPRDIKAFVRKYMLKVYPQLKDTRIDYAWGGTLAVTVNRMPHFGNLDGKVFYAQGYSGHGVAMASLAGKLIALAITGNSEKFNLLKDIPTRTFPGGRYLRWPALVLGMLYYSLLDKL